MIVLKIKKYFGLLTIKFVSEKAAQYKPVYIIDPKTFPITTPSAKLTTMKKESLSVCPSLNFFGQRSSVDFTHRVGHTVVQKYTHNIG